MWFFSKKSPASPIFGTASPAGGGARLRHRAGHVRATVSRICATSPADSLDLRAPLLDSGYIDSLSATDYWPTLSAGTVCALANGHRRQAVHHGGAGKRDETASAFSE